MASWCFDKEEPKTYLISFLGMGFVLLLVFTKFRLIIFYISFEAVLIPTKFWSLVYRTVHVKEVGMVVLYFNHPYTSTLAQATVAFLLKTPSTFHTNELQCSRPRISNVFNSPRSLRTASQTFNDVCRSCWWTCTTSPQPSSSRRRIGRPLAC